MNKVPKIVKKLINKRKLLRKYKRFEASDKIRNEIEKYGYKVEDEKKKTILIKENDQKPKNSFVVLFGSGEIASSGRKIHEFVFKHIRKDPINIDIITTPAGFQPNVKNVHEEIAEFFTKSLANFHPKINIIFANTLFDANNQELIKPIENSDYIFAGPGSPTYAVRNLRNTLLYKLILKRVRKGATLSLSSAAVIAFSKYCLPVYEIYKVGEKLHWIKGLNFFEELIEPMTIVPHLNNNEGGVKLDTSYSFLGKNRFKSLLNMLPKKEKVVGIDEHTAFIYNIGKKKFFIEGKGSIKVLQT